MKSNNQSNIHIPVAILIGEGKLITDGAAAHPEVSTRLPEGYLTQTGTVLTNLMTLSTGQKQQRGQAAVLRAFDALIVKRRT